MEGDLPDDAVSVAVQRSSTGRAALVPVAVQRLTGQALDNFADLEHAALQAAKARDAVTALVIEARSLGTSWNSIGWAVGTAANSARERWSGDV